MAEAAVVLRLVLGVVLPLPTAGVVLESALSGPQSICLNLATLPDWISSRGDHCSPCFNNGSPEWTILTLLLAVVMAVVMAVALAGTDDDD